MVIKVNQQWWPPTAAHILVGLIHPDMAELERINL